MRPPVRIPSPPATSQCEPPVPFHAHIAGLLARRRQMSNGDLKLTAHAEISKRDLQALSKSQLIFIATVRKDGHQSKAAPVDTASCGAPTAPLRRSTYQARVEPAPATSTPEGWSLDRTHSQGVLTASSWTKKEPW